MQPEDEGAAEELEEVKYLQRQQLAQRVGVPGLHIEQPHGKLPIACTCLKLLLPGLQTWD